MSKRIWLIGHRGGLCGRRRCHRAISDHGEGRRQSHSEIPELECQQLWQEKAQGQGKPKPEMEQRAIQMLRQDPQMRQAFFNKVAAPIVNKMFECGMIP